MKRGRSASPKSSSLEIQVHPPWTIFSWTTTCVVVLNVGNVRRWSGCTGLGRARGGLHVLSNRIGPRFPYLKLHQFGRYKSITTLPGSILEFVFHVPEYTSGSMCVYVA